MAKKKRKHMYGLPAGSTVTKEQWESALQKHRTSKDE